MINMNLKFLRCNKCGNVVEIINEENFKIFCCNERMFEIQIRPISKQIGKSYPEYQLIENEVFVDASSYHVENNEYHNFLWIIIKTKLGYQFQNVDVEFPLLHFSLSDNDFLESVYGYSDKNILWQIFKL